MTPGLLPSLEQKHSNGAGNKNIYICLEGFMEHLKNHTPLDMYPES